MTLAIRRSLSLAALAASAALTTSTASAQLETRGVWVPMFRGAYLHNGARPLQLAGGLIPRIGRRTTLNVSAPGSNSGMLMLGTQASTGIQVPFSHGFLPLYTTPLVTLPLAMPNGSAQLSVDIPNDTRLIGADLALQAAGVGQYGLAVSNLLLANIGARDNGPFGKIAIRFSGRAPKHERSNVRVISGDVKDMYSASMPVLTNFGPGHYMNVIVGLDRDLTAGQTIQIRTGTQQTGTLVGEVTKRTDSLMLKVPAGSISVPLHLYLHNTDPSADIGIAWEFVGF